MLKIQYTYGINTNIVTTMIYCMKERINFSENSDETKVKNSQNWWLRTPITQGFIEDEAYEIRIVDYFGDVSRAFLDEPYGVRPAFNHTEAVLFTSAADGKKTDNVGKILENTEYTDNE